MRLVFITLLTLPFLIMSYPSWADTTVESANDFATTLQKLRDAIEASPASIISEVDHAAAAEGAGLELGATTLVIFGNPQAGTQLMQADQRVGLALPMKMLVIETADGVRLVFDDPSDLAETYELGDAAAVTERMSGLVASLAEAAAN